MGKFQILLLSIILLMAGCQGQGGMTIFATPVSNQIAVHTHEHDEHTQQQVTEDTSTTLSVVLVPSELVVGPNRFAVGLLRAAGDAVHDADVYFRYFDLRNADAPRLESEAPAVRLQTDDGFATIFAHERTFDWPGNWGVEVQTDLPNGKTAINRIRFQVRSDVPGITPGEMAPAINSPTMANVGGDLSRLSSATVPNPALYELSLADITATAKPTMLLFATPAFCQTRFCGSNYEIISTLQQQYADALNFIHVEVFEGLPNPAQSNWELSPAMVAFGLATEPWLYLIDAEGRVRYRVEGMFTQAEVIYHLQHLFGLPARSSP